MNSDRYETFKLFPTSGCHPAGLLLVAPSTQPAKTLTSSVPSIVMRASTAFSATVRGVIGMQRHFVTTVRAGPVTHTEQSDSGQLMQNGQFAKIAYYRIMRDGKPFSPLEIQQRYEQTNKEWADGKVYFKEPYDEHYLNDYTFESPQAPCSSCPAGSKAVAFASALHDAQHGSGVMYIDSRNAHVVKLTYVPYQLPPHANSGTVTEIGGQALPDLWYVVRIDETYGGHEFILSGTGTFTGAFDHFRRFPNLVAGKMALQDQTI